MLQSPVKVEIQRGQKIPLNPPLIKGDFEVAPFEASTNLTIYADLSILSLSNDTYCLVFEQ